MSNLAWIIVLVFALTVVGFAAIGLVTKHFYWGSRGKPPLTSEQRRVLKEEQERSKNKSV